jgi:hypothetical protein
LSGLLRRFRAIQQTQALGVEVAQKIRLRPVSQNPKQQVSGQVRRRSPSEHRVPTRSERTNVDFVQARDLDVDGLVVRSSQTNLAAGHDN